MSKTTNKKQDTTKDVAKGVAKDTVKDTPREAGVTEKLQGVNVRRSAPPKTKEVQVESRQYGVSAGPLDRVLDFTYNASREKSREVTVISPVQGRLLPVLDVINTAWESIIETAAFRLNQAEYAVVYERDKPRPPNLIAEYIHRLSQWQKSVGGVNLKSLNDLALAEMETKTDDEGDGFGNIDAWADK